LKKTETVVIKAICQTFKLLKTPLKISFKKYKPKDIVNAINSFFAILLAKFYFVMEDLQRREV
jgi:hypothetical protein